MVPVTRRAMGMLRVSAKAGTISPVDGQTHPMNPADPPHRDPEGEGTVIIGAGPAGLTAAYQLGKAGWPATVLEADDVVGGISRTVVRDGWRFDIGGHRFFTKVR
ncbi:uncharacterized protein METZ01_LOCUS147894, partial [marine metagenome]